MGDCKDGEEEGEDEGGTKGWVVVVVRIAGTWGHVAILVGNGRHGTCWDRDGDCLVGLTGWGAAIAMDWGHGRDSDFDNADILGCCCCLAGYSFGFGSSVEGRCECTAGDAKNTEYDTEVHCE